MKSCQKHWNLNNKDLCSGQSHIMNNDNELMFFINLLLTIVYFSFIIIL